MAYAQTKCYNLEMKDIPGFEGLYAITKSGNVWSYPKKYGKYVSTGKFIKSNVNPKDGYTYIILYKDKKPNTRKIHRLVAITYILNIENKKEVNHKNGIKTDNNVINLEWCTRQENATHASKNNLLKKNTNHWNCRLSDYQISKIRKIALTKKYSQRKIGELFGVNQSTIWKIIHNQRRII